MLQLNKESWNRNKEIYIWIFNVGRGFSSFIKTPHNFGVMYDCGSAEDLRPFEDVVKKHFLKCLDQPRYRGKQHKLAQVIVSHPHSDHCSEIKSVLASAPPMLLTSPHSNDRELDEEQHVNWSLVDNPPYAQDAVAALKHEVNKREPPLRAYGTEPGFEAPRFAMEIFFIPAKINERQLPREHYANNLSIVLYLSLGNNSCIFMGDLMPSGCEYLLNKNVRFRNVVKNRISFVAVPHHGLESAFYKPFYQLMYLGKVKAANIVSEKRDLAPNEGKTHPDYTSSQLANGYQGRYSFSTKHDGHIRIILGAGSKVKVDTSHNIVDLLEG